MRNSSQYDIKKVQVSQETLQYSRQRNKNLLPKIPDRKIKRQGSTSFISQVQRFNTNNNPVNTPGPGSYELIQSKTFKQIHKEQILPREHLWIIDDTRFRNNARSPTGYLGPGSYDINPKVKISNKVTEWGLVERFHTKSENQNLGPGSYNYIQLKQTPSPSIFKSNEARTFDKIIYHTNKLDKANSLNVNNYKDTSPGPGTYSIQQNSQKNKKSFIFESKVPRFVAKKQFYDICPGMYQIESDFDRNLKKIQSPKRSILKIAKLPQKIVKQKDISEPGPGAYQTPQTIQNNLLKKYLNGYKGDFGSHQKRFQRTKFHKFIPGPGHYHKPQKSIEYDHKLKQLKYSSNFISNSDRSLFDQNKKQIPFVGNYNLKMFDISYQANKKKEHLEKLRKIQIQVPAFEVGSRR